MEVWGAQAVAHIIQLAVAPVFLISGVAALLTGCTNCLSRIINRRLIHRCITLATTSALLISMVIVILFLGVFLPLEVTAIVGVLFVGAMIALIPGLVTFLKEFRPATFTLCLYPAGLGAAQPGGAQAPAEKG